MDRSLEGHKNLDFLQTNADSLAFALMQDCNFNTTEFDRTIDNLLETPEEIISQQPYVIAYILYYLLEEEFSVDKDIIKNILTKINLDEFDAPLLKFV